MKLTENIMMSIENVHYETSFCKRGKVSSFRVGKKWFYFFFDNETVEIEDTKKIVKTIKGLKAQFKKYSGGEEMVFFSSEL